VEGTGQTIRLKRNTWTVFFDRPVNAEMEFRTVFEGEGPAGKVAVKRIELKSADIPFREMELAPRFLGKSFRHLVNVFDYGHDAASAMDFVVLERCPDTLWHYLDQRKRVPEAEAIGIVTQLLGGLLEMDGLTHNDLRPENVLGAAGQWKITDFGRARFREELSPRATLNKDVAYFFAPPELWMREGPAETTDIYGLGGMLYRLIAGRPPFTGERDEVRAQHFYANPEPIQNVSGALNALIARMMAKDPARRPKKEEVARALNADAAALVGARVLSV